MPEYTYANLTFEMRPSSRRQTYGLTVDRDSSLVLHVPEPYSEQLIEDFLHEKLLWIHTKLAEKEFFRSGHFPARQFRAGEGFAYNGRIYQLRLEPHALQNFRFQNGRFILRSAKGARQLFINWYQQKGMEKLPILAEEYCRRAGVEFKGIKMLDLSNRWGSCSDKGVLNFHWKSMQLPTKFQRYIVAHEVTHLLEKHHTPRFWNLLERMMPEYEEYESGLNTDGLKFLRLS